MRWTNKPYVNPKTKWHSFFPLFPRLVEGNWVWLERVERKGRYIFDDDMMGDEAFWSWKYRNVTEKENK